MLWLSRSLRRSIACPVLAHYHHHHSYSHSQRHRGKNSDNWFVCTHYTLWWDCTWNVHFSCGSDWIWALVAYERTLLPFGGYPNLQEIFAFMMRNRPTDGPSETRTKKKVVNETFGSHSMLAEMMCVSSSFTAGRFCVIYPTMTTNETRKRERGKIAVQFIHAIPRNAEMAFVGGALCRWRNHSAALSTCGIFFKIVFAWHMCKCVDAMCFILTWFYYLEFGCVHSRILDE